MITELLCYIIFSFFASVCILCLHMATFEGMALHKIYRIAWNWPWYFRSPLFECYPCMCSVWGSFFWIVWHLSGFMPGELISTNWIWFVLFTGGINYAISVTILNRIDELF